MNGQTAYSDAAIELIADALQSGHPVKIRGHGASMIPTIWPGDVLTIRSVTGGLPLVGEIVLTRGENGLRAHRVIAHRTLNDVTSIVTRGDALGRDDSNIGLSAVLGTVICRNDEPLYSPKSYRRRLFEKALLRSRALQTIALKLNALRNRYAWPLSSRQFA